jgi:predicted PurR-regulated permease PerM
MSADHEFTRRMVRTVLTVVAVIIVLAALWVARSALMLIYISALIAMGLSPLVRIIQTGERRIPRTLAILVIYVAVVGLFIVVALTVVPPLVEQAAELWNRAPRAFNQIQSYLIRHRIMRRTVTLEEAVQNAPAGSSGNALNTVFFAVWSVVGGVFGIVTILILSFYLLVDAPGLFGYLTRLVPAASRGPFVTVSREIVKKVSAWLSAQFILAGVMGTCAAIGLGLLRLPYFYVVALIAAVGETIPIVGPIVAGVSAVAVALSVSPKLAVLVGGYFLVLHLLEANFLVPKVMERRVGVSPVTVIVALLIGGDLWGILGAILAIPTAAILSVIVTELTSDAAA